MIMGVPLSAVISPIIYALAVVVVDLVNLATPIADPLTRVAGSGSADTLTAAQYGLVALALLVPGALALLVSWLGVKRLLRHGIAGAPILALGARDPRPDHLDEQQLANLVAETAIAAGIAAPGLKLLDSPVVNAGVVGGSLADATIVVTTGLLDALDRDETQAVAAQLVGSTGNGDLRIGVTLTSLFLSLGAVGSFLGAPADRTSRNVAWRLLRYGFGRSRDVATEATLITDLLADKHDWDQPGYEPKTGLLSILTLPFLMASGAFAMNRLLFGPFLVSPFLKRRWWARRYRADASAVQLTRNPTALAGALTKLASNGGVIPGTEWSTHQFIVGGEEKTQPEVADLHAPIPQRLARLVRMGAEIAPPDIPRKTGLYWAFVIITSPLWLGFLFMMYGIGLALTAISFAIDGLFLAPVVGVIHGLLRGIGR